MQLQFLSEIPFKHTGVLTLRFASTCVVYTCRIRPGASLVEINEGMSGIKQTHKMKCENKTPGAYASPSKVCNEIRKFKKTIVW